MGYIPRPMSCKRAGTRGVGFVKVYVLQDIWAHSGKDFHGAFHSLSDADDYAKDLGWRDRDLELHEMELVPNSMKTE